MSRPEELLLGVDPVAVSTPGGFARQFRVQYHSATEPDWHFYATFRIREPAVDCLDRLQRRGYEARLVSYAICPFAG